MAMKNITIQLVGNRAGEHSGLLDALAACGYTLSPHAHGARQASHLMHAQRPDLVLIGHLFDDASTPDEAAERIAAEVDVPMLFLASNADEAANREASIDCLYAPYHPHQIRLTVEYALCRWQAGVTPTTENGADKAFVEIGRDPSTRTFRQIYHAFDSLLDAVFLIDQQGHLHYVNRTACKSLGYRRDELLQLHVVDFAPMVLPQTWPRLWARVWEMGQSIFESEHRHRDGELFPVEINANVFSYEKTPYILAFVRDVRERNAMRMALTSQQESIRQYLEVAKIMLVALDARGCIALVNPWACQVLGYPEHALLGANWFDRVLPKADMERVKAVYRQLMAGELAPVENYENPIVTRSGELRHIAWRNSVLHDSEGNIAGIFSSGEDITDRLLNERRLQESESQLKTIFDTARIGIMLITGQRVLVRCNAYFANILGYDSAEEMVGFSMRRLHLSEQNFLEFGQKYFASLQRRESNHIEYALRRKDGSAVWCRISGKALDNTLPADLSKGVIWVIDDITRLKKTQQELKAAYELLLENKKLFSGGPAVVFRWSLIPTRAAYFCSENVELALGYTPEDFMQKRVAYIDLVHPQDQPQMLNEMNAYLAAGADHFEQEYRLRHADGRYLIFYDFCRVVRGGNGQPESLHGYLLDVTEKRNAEKERGRIERELYQSRKMEALGQLSGGIAHEFNNMLAIILGHAGLMKLNLELTSDSKFMQYLGHIENAGNRAKNLVRQMLTFGQKQERQLLPVALKPLVQEAITLSRATLPSSIDIVYAPQPGLPDVLMDAGEVQQILMNLFVNARDAMNGQGQLHINLNMLHLSNKEECPTCHTILGGDWVALSVADNGIGMQPAVMARIFEPFFTTKETGKGTGLGLAVIHSIMESNGGHISVQSESGKGTRFRLLFPPFQSPRQENSEVAESVLAQAPCQLSGRVLLVDDEPSVTLFMTEMLRNCGLHVTSVNDSHQALKLLYDPRYVFDLLITDQTMPVFVGTELAAAAKSVRATLPIILCTGYSDVIDESNAETFSVDYYLVKPVNIDELTGILKTVLAPQTTNH
jgi:PAS domain S-box-containing protein